MNESEHLIHSLAKDVAVMAETQKAFQRYQAQTTDNIAKLTQTVDVLAKEAVRLEGIFANISSVNKRIDKLEVEYNRRMERIEAAYTTWSKVVLGGALVAFIGVVFKYVGA